MAMLVPSLAIAQEPTDDLETITITATRNETPVFDVPPLVSVIDQATLERRNVRTTPEALQEEVGILVQETNLGGGSPFVRGQTGNRILVLVDGVRLNNSTFRFGPNQYLNTVDAHQIDRIEVVHGPSSVLYGSDALGGVINVITNRRRDFSQPFSLNGSARTQFGSAAFEKTVRLETSGNRGPLGFVGGATWRDFQDLNAGSPTGEQDHTGYDEIDGDARLQYRIQPEHEVAVAFQRVTQSRVPNTVAFTLDNESFVFDPQQRTLYLAEHRLGDLPWGFGGWRTTVSYQEQLEVRKRRRFSSPVLRREKDDTGTVGVISDVDWIGLQPHVLIGGIEFYHDHVDSSRVDRDSSTGTSTSLRAAFPDGSEYDTLGLFLQSQVDAGDVAQRLGAAFDLPLTFIGGARYSRFSIDSKPEGFGRLERDFDEATGSIAAMYEAISGLNLVASFAQGFRAPNLDDTVVLRAVPEQGGIDTPNPDLDPERVDNYEGGVKVDLPYVTGGLFYFFSKYSDLIERRAISFDDQDGDGMQGPSEPTVFQRQNIGAAEVQGVEVALDAPVVAGLGLRSNFSWIRGENTTANEPFSRIPPILGLVGVYHESAVWPVWTELFVRFAGKQDRLSARDESDGRIQDGGTPAWQTVNIRGGWKPSEWLELNLSLENIGDVQYRLHGSGIDAPGFNAVGSALVRF